MAIENLTPPKLQNNTEEFVQDIFVNNYEIKIFKSIAKYRISNSMYKFE